MIHHSIIIITSNQPPSELWHLMLVRNYSPDNRFRNGMLVLLYSVHVSGRAVLPTPAANSQLKRLRRHTYTHLIEADALVSCLQL
jgi:hypothetical protein